MARMIRSRLPEQPSTNIWKIASIFLICFTLFTEIYLVVIIYQKNVELNIKQAKINNLMTEIHQAGEQQQDKEVKLKKKVAKQAVQFNSANFISVKQFNAFRKTHNREISRLKREINRLKKAKK